MKVYIDGQEVADRITLSTRRITPASIQEAGLMAVGINVVQDDLETLFVQVQLSGMTAGTRYDVHRLQVRFLRR